MPQSGTVSPTSRSSASRVQLEMNSQRADVPMSIRVGMPVTRSTSRAAVGRSSHAVSHRSRIGP